MKRELDTTEDNSEDITNKKQDSGLVNGQDINPESAALEDDGGDDVDVSEIQEEWLPPSIRQMDTHFNSITYTSPVPDFGDTPLILGVDEAGRGPILGPMVYTVAYCKEEYANSLRKYGFDDSKVLKHDFRLALYKLIDEEHHDLNDNIGYLTTILSAKDISSGMLRVHQGNYNLNEQAHDTTINLVRLLVAKNVNIKHVYVDTVGPPDKYQAKLTSIFSGNNIKFTVTKKADSIYPIVSCASVIAKVTRDLYLHHFNQVEPLLKGTDLGSGYPGDPRTTSWLSKSIDNVFGWHFGILRYSWQTAKDNLVKHKAVEIENETDTYTSPYRFTNQSFGKKVDL